MPSAPTASTLTPEAKGELSKTIRALRTRLLTDLRDEADARYRLSVPIAQAGLDEAHRVRRARLEAWLDERARASGAKGAKDLTAARARLLAAAVKEAAATLLNRLVALRHLEALGLSKPRVATGGWESAGYRELREFAPALVRADATEGYAPLLALVFDELARDLPGLFGDVGTTRLFPVPAATLRALVEALDAPALASAWGDDTTLGWVYQYWNDPDREALDAKIKDGGKVAPHEIASKTQMFTERYMVEWLLHNSLGLLWLCICRKNGWRPDAQCVLDGLDTRRAEWRAKRDAGDVALDALMPIEGELEARWKYYVPQPIPDAMVASAPASVHDVKLLDPACGSGHFLVIAFDLLAALYREQARHTGQAMSDRAIAEAIVENNLHGIDIDPRAVQIAAAGVYLKARALAHDARPGRMNLVAPALNLAGLAADDPALRELEREVERETGIPGELTGRVVRALAGVDHLGSLLKVDAAVEDAVRDYEGRLGKDGGQGDLWGGYARKSVSAESAKRTVLEGLERFLERHSGEGDLGLRLDGEQLASGVRFVRLAREGTYDVVVGNPPYQGTGKMADSAYVAKEYPRGKADLYAAFIERGLQLTREGGLSAMVTMRGWMFLGQYGEIRKWIVSEYDLRNIGDLGTGAFSSRSMDDVISTALAVVRKGKPSSTPSVALRPASLSDSTRDSGKPMRRRAALLAQIDRFEFDTAGFEVIEGQPIVYWWSIDFLRRYAATTKLSTVTTVRYGLSTQDNTRYLRAHWEVAHSDVMHLSFDESRGWDGSKWVPYIKGAEGRKWFDAVLDVVRWENAGLELATYPQNRFGRGTDHYFERGIAFVNIGTNFSARVHRTQSIFGHVAGSVFTQDIGEMLCMLNSARASFVMESLNPGLHFLTTDVERLPVFRIDGADTILSTLETAFTRHESAREPSVEFRSPAPSPWRYAQSWAQLAVDRPANTPLPPYSPVYDPPEPAAFISFALGVALGRFAADGTGILATAPASALPAGILFLSAASERDSLAHAACDPLRAAFDAHGPAVAPDEDLRTYLRRAFFAYHRDLYENRPIYLPLCSARRAFVAFVAIHRFTDATLATLLADHLHPEKRSLEGELADLRTARTATDRAARTRAEKRFADVQKLLAELTAFIDAVTACANHGPPSPDAATPARERDAAYAMDLDDGVMVNAAALWPLLEPQWKDPKKWWKELARAEGRKDYDWSHLAARYFPARVAAKCKADPSLAVAHGCFWRLHPAKAYAWELRLQDEIGAGFAIEEAGAAEAREGFLRDCAKEAAEARASEQARRERKARKQGDGDAGASAEGGLFDAQAGDGDASSDGEQGERENAEA